MASSSKPTLSEFSLVVVLAICHAGVAFLMWAGSLVYPPVPMFAAAVIAGILYPGRARQAARAGLLAGLASGWLTEWLYFGVRLKLAAGNWGVMPPGERFWLAIAEWLLYTSLLSFFAAFISWGINPDSAMNSGKKVPGKDTRIRKSKQAIPFNPTEDEVRELPFFSAIPAPIQPPQTKKDKPTL